MRALENQVHSYKFFFFHPEINGIQPLILQAILRSVTQRPIARNFCKQQIKPKIKYADISTIDDTWKLG